MISRSTSWSPTWMGVGRRAIGCLPYIAAERGFIDAVIEPHQTRLQLRKALNLLWDKQIQRVQRKHPLIPI
jgi:acetyl-CoA carboxylase carboxyltransferase component